MLNFLQGAASSLGYNVMGNYGDSLKNYLNRTKDDTLQSGLYLRNMLTYFTEALVGLTMNNEFAMVGAILLDACGIGRFGSRLFQGGTLLFTSTALLDTLYSAGLFSVLNTCTSLSEGIRTGFTLTAITVGTSLLSYFEHSSTLSRKLDEIQILSKQDEFKLAAIEFDISTQKLHDDMQFHYSNVYDTLFKHEIASTIFMPFIALLAKHFFTGLKDKDQFKIIHTIYAGCSVALNFGLDSLPNLLYSAAPSLDPVELQQIEDKPVEVELEVASGDSVFRLDEEFVVNALEKQYIV